MQTPVRALTSAAFLLLTLFCRGQKTAQPGSDAEIQFLKAITNGKEFNGNGKAISAKFFERMILNPPQTDPFKRIGIWVTNVKIVGDIDLHNATVAFPIDIKKSIFIGKVYCNDIKVNNYCMLEADTFYKPVDLTFATFTETLNMGKSTFFSTLDLSYITAKQDLYLDSALLADTCTLFEGNIGTDLILSSANFQDSGSVVDAGSCTIGGGLSMDKGIFWPRFRFSGSTIGHNINLDHSDFRDSLDFVAVTVGNQVDADSADFKWLNFNSAVVKGLIQFNHAFVETNLNFSYLLADKSSLELTNCNITNGNLDGMEVGRVNLTKSHFYDNLDLRYTKTGMLTITSVQYPDFPCCKIDSLIALDGLTYNRLLIDTANDEESLRKYLALLNRIPLSQNSYVAFEQYCKNNNFSDLADEVYVDYKNREPRGIRHFVLHWLVGYGRYPFRVLIPAAVLILIGFIVFRNERWMMPAKADEANSRYSLWWYSFDVFIPVINLNEAEKWIPKPEYIWMRFYRRLLALLGWLMVPVGLAGISGLIK